MGTVNSILTNFTAGEISPRVYGRVDLAKYANGARELTNVTVLPQGGARKRGGTLNISNVRQNSPDAILVPFVFSTEQAYMLEFGPGYIRFFKDRGIIFDNSFNIASITSGASTVIGLLDGAGVPGHTLQIGDPIIIAGVHGMAELNNREFAVSAKTATTITIALDSSSYTPFTSGGTAYRVYEVATAFSAADLEHMNFTQSADTLFLFNDQWPIALLQRQSHADWTFDTANVEEGPFLDMNTDEANTASIDVASGAGIMTFSKDTLKASHVGALFRIWEKANGSTFGYATWAPGATVIVADGSFWEYKGNVYYVVSGGGAQMASTASYPTHTKGTVEVFYGTGSQIASMRYEHSGYCVVQVTNVVDTKNANVVVVKNRTPYTAYGARSSFQWQEGAWSDERGYPTTATFHEQRLVAANTEYQPTTLWGSVLDAYLKFKDGDKDDEAYTYTISSDQVDAIKHMSTTKRLVINATSGEYIVAASNQNEAISPTNIKISRETSFGIADVKPVRAGPAILFAQRKGKNTNPSRRLRELVYNFQTDSYTAPDLTILSEHITHPGIVQGAYVASPDLMIWYARTDGHVAAMTYERDQQVVGWHHHIVGGGGLVRHVASIPGGEGDELWMIVERFIGGQAVRNIEVGTQGLVEGDQLADAFFLDNALPYNGPPTFVLTGLWHLNGETVSVLLDGVPFHDLTVTNGSVTLPVAATKALVGYRYKSRIKTLHVEAGAQGGTAQGQIGRVFEIIARLQNSVGGTFGSEGQLSNGKLDPIPYRSADEPLATPVPIFSGDQVLPFDGEWDRDRYIVIEHDEPLPFTLTALVIGQRVSG
jgi:hypothetical protein